MGFLPLFLAVFMLFVAGCGKGGTSTGGDASPVTLSFSVPSSGPHAAAAVPSNVASIKVEAVEWTPSETAINLLTDTFNVVAGSNVTRNYSIPAGLSREFTVSAYSGAGGSGTLLYQGSTMVDLSPGVPATVTISMTAMFSQFYWSNTYGAAPSSSNGQAHSVRQTVDSGYIVAGYTYTYGTGGDAWVSKLNADGTVAWQNTYGGANLDMAQSVQQTSDMGYITAGYTNLGPSNDLSVIKLNPGGTIAWAKTYGGAGEDAGFSIQQTSDGGYIVAGYTISFGAGGGDIWVLKLDPGGNVTWQKTYGGVSYDEAYSVRQTSDGGYIVAGFTNSFGAGLQDMWVLKLDPAGNVAWQKTYGGGLSDYASEIQQTSDGGYIVASSIGSGSNKGVIKLNPDGTIAWQKAYGWGWVISVQQTSDGGYIAAGASSSSIMMKLDSSGALAWYKEYSPPLSFMCEILYSVIQTSSGGYVAAGCSDQWGYDVMSPFVISVDANGDIGASCTAITSPAITVTDTAYTDADSTAIPADTSVVGMPYSAIQGGSTASPAALCSVP